MLYRSLASALQYLTLTRLYISYAVQEVCLYRHDPREPHLAALKRILRYVWGTMDFGPHLYSSTTTSLVGYADPDWVGFPSTRWSTLVYCVFLGDNLLFWSFNHHQTLSHSSAEAEYRGVANVVAEKAWLRNLLCELHSPLSSTTLVYFDNVSVIYLSANPVQHQRTKHIEITFTRPWHGYRWSGVCSTCTTPLSVRWCLHQGKSFCFNWGVLIQFECLASSYSNCGIVLVVSMLHRPIGILM